MLNSERFCDSAPRQVYATLLDEGTYLCSWPTMYRILRAYEEVNERRNQLQRPVYTKPELLATAPNQVWSWDITKLRGPMPHVYYYMYTILDIFSRYVVGYLIAQIFFGLWLFPLGYLIFKSGYWPKVLGILFLLMAGLFVWVIWPAMGMPVMLPSEPLSPLP